MTPAVEELQRRALVMRRLRVVVSGLVPVLMFLYVPPPGVASQLDPARTSVALVLALLVVTAASAAVHRLVATAPALARWSRLELAADTLICLGILQVFSFDQFSSIWTILVVVSLEGAFREGRRGALIAWSASGVVYAGMQVVAAARFPETAPLDIGSIVFRAVVTGVVAAVAGQLAAQLQAAVERHRMSEVALAEQYADLRLIGRVSRAIAAGPEARGEVCRAVAELSGATVVLLLEPDGDHLRGTAAAGCAAGQLAPLSLSDDTSGAVRAFQSGQVTMSRRAELPLNVGRSKGVAGSAAYIPVRSGDTVMGALCLTFDQPMDRLPDRIAAALQVLAEEAAVAITRADLTASLAEQARRDVLTGLVNRRGMEESLETEMQRSRRTRAPLTVLMLDLDGLKVFNDTYGHEAGDRLLSAASNAWLARLRPTDVLARYGGDEFVALLPGCDEHLAMRVADALIAALPPGGACSVGLAEWDGRESVAALLGRADTALYEGKRAGGGRAIRALPARPEQRASGPEAGKRDSRSA